MESLNPYLSALTPLTSLANQVEAFAERCLPDYTPEEVEDIVFEEKDLSDYFGGVPDLVSLLRLKDSPSHNFTEWSRLQLLSHLGTREKWFSTVSKAQEVSELNVRRHVLKDKVFRTMSSMDDDNLRILRGIVTKRFADIPDTMIMKAVLDITNGFALAGWSGKTDRAFYAYIVTSEPIGIPETTFRAFPGLVLKNSEVGYTSLWVSPMLFFTVPMAPIVLRSSEAVLRRVHRGDTKDLRIDFMAALHKISSIWGPLETKLQKLRHVSYATADEALTALDKTMERSGAKRELIHRCRLAYAKTTKHTALAVFEAILQGIDNTTNRDIAHLNSEIAGAVLFRLLR